MNDEHERNPGSERRVPRLVTLRSHRDPGAKRSADRGGEQQRSFANSAPAPSRSLFVLRHEHESRRVNDYQIHP